MAKMQDDIGQVAWTTVALRAAYPEFQAVYKDRPLASNDGGMKAPHAFLTWFIMKTCQPSLIVESGVWRGQGTWLIEQACPEAELVCLDIDFSPLVYKAPNAEYIQSDFDTVDFSDRDLSAAICFFDDHQNALTRLQQMLWKGFRTAIFEDNYPTGKGDCYSLKQAFAGVGQAPPTEQTASRPSLLKRLKGTNLVEAQAAHVPPNLAHRHTLMSRIKTYYEGPPLLRLESTRWGDPWDDRTYPTKPALFTEDEADEQTKAEAAFFTWLCFVEIDGV